MKVLKLRPHHINCIFFYEGKGYSEGFVKNMNQIVDQLRNNPKQLVSFERTNDILCNNCPNQRGSNCVNAQRIDQLDKNTLLNYNVEEHKVYSFAEIIKNIYTDYNNESFQAICKSCEWYKQGVCSQEKIRQRESIWTNNK